MIERLEEISLDSIPLTKRLLEIYVLRMDEEFADLSDEALKKELLILVENNQLVRLIIAEALINSFL